MSILKIAEGFFDIAPTVAKVAGLGPIGGLIGLVGEAIGLSDGTPEEIDAKFSAMTSEDQKSIFIEIEKTKQVEMKALLKHNLALTKLWELQAKGSPYQANARPTVIYTICYGSAILFTCMPVVLGLAISGNTTVIDQFVKIMQEADTVIMSLSAVAGVYVWSRGNEKIKGVANNLPTPKSLVKKAKGIFSKKGK